MTASPTMIDFSTYGRRQVDIWSGEDETKKVERQESERALPMNMMTGLDVTALPARASQASWAITIADYSILDRTIDHPSYATSGPTIVPPVPLPLKDSHYEMLCYKSLEDGWDDVSSKGISADAVDVALAFLRLLPSDVSAPEASASGDGTVDWYWRNTKRGCARHRCRPISELP